MRRTIVLLLILCCAFPLFSEESTQSPESPKSDAESTAPVPYSEEEFPEWLIGLRRAEIVAMGSLPITFVASFFAYDIIRYMVHGFDRSYLPIGSPNPVPYSLQENLGVLTAACTVSGIIAIIDGMIGRARKKKMEEAKIGDLEAQDH